VIEGVANNLGFGKSILENKAFREGNYDTSFIPTYYPNGYAGNALESRDKQVVAIAGFMMKNRDAANNCLTTSAKEIHATVYTTVVLEEGNSDWAVARRTDGSLAVTELSTGEQSVHNIQDYSFEHNSLMDI
jgi:acetyl/propionyl-CoA carboxylase alpha subunit